jgi:Tfp pilus assembly protein PilO
MIISTIFSVLVFLLIVSLTFLYELSKKKTKEELEHKQDDAILDELKKEAKIEKVVDSSAINKITKYMETFTRDLD